MLGWLVVLWVMFGFGRSLADVTDLQGSGLDNLLQESETWMGVYHRENKLGSIYSKTIKLPEGFRFEQHSRLMLNLAGSQQKVVTNLQVWLDKRQVFQRFELKLQAGPLKGQLNGKLDQGKLVVTINLGAETIEKIWPLDGPPIFNFALPKLLAQYDLRKGRRFRVTVFDPQTLTNQATEIEVIGPEVLKTSQGLKSTIRLRRSLAGNNLDTWIDEAGMVLQEEYALGLMLRKEDQAVANTEIKVYTKPDTVQDSASVLHLLMPDSLGGRSE
ncbi:MAG: hypothetical protein JRJ19_09805 [Deltaproteobacteria bacterium]|nr:hypothetical protein [Deltaproteobacteria bacterium]